MKTSKLNCFVYSLKHPHATGHCEDILLDTGTVRHGLGSQALGKVAQI